MKPNVLAWIACVTLCTSPATAAVITVNSADNTLINPNDTLTNLVEALMLAQEGDQIHFNIPGPGPHYLETPAGGYPTITANNLTLDGYTQPGASPNTNPILAANNAELRIVLDSRNGGRTVQDIDGYGTSESAILFVTGATNVEIRGFSFLGVVAAGSDADPAMYCVSFGLKATDGHVHGCWMGVDPDGVTVHGANDGVTGFRFRENDVPFLSDRITVGVAKDAIDPRAQFNVIVGMTIPVIIEGAGTRISGNFLSVMPDGVTDYNVTLIHGQGFEGQIEIGRDGANTVIGTDGDGVNDADERNVMGGVIPRSYNPQGYDTVIEFYGGNNRTNVVIAGNYIGVGVDGETWFTNSARIVRSLASLSTVQIGSDFDGVSDELEGNFIVNNHPVEVFFPDPTIGLPPEFIMADAGARVSLRGNRLVNNFPPPYSTFTTGVDRYYEPYLQDTNVIVPVLSETSSTARLIGTAPLPNETNIFSNVILDVYLPDPVGLSNGVLFEFPELPEGFVQGETWLGSFLEGGPEDLNPTAGEFEFDISSLGLTAGTRVTVAASFSADDPGTTRGRAHTTPFALPVELTQGMVEAPVAGLYDAPPGGWIYIMDGSAATAGAPDSGFTSLDGSWSHDNGSDAWDGSDVGGTLGDANRPGGVGTVDGVLRIQDAGEPRDHGFPGDDPIPSNRKIYFGRDLTAEGASDTLLDDGVTLYFRARVATAGLVDELHPAGNPDGAGPQPYPSNGDGYLIHDGGKGNFGIKQASGGIISFSLATAGDTGSIAGLLMNNLNGSAISGTVDSGEAGTANVLPLDPTRWHEFWITLEGDTSGGGTHRVEVYLDGSLAPRTFHVTAGSGSDFGGITYLGLGAGSTGQSGALDVDFFTYAAGAVAPAQAAIATFTDANLMDSTLTLNWAGGQGPFTVQHKTSLEDAAWTDVTTIAGTSATVPAGESTGFFRLVNQVVFDITLSGDAVRPNPVTTSGNGSGTLTLQGHELTYDISYSDLSGTATAAHLHGMATIEQSAGVIQRMTAPGGLGVSGSLQGAMTLSDDNVLAVLSGLTYVNIHTGNNPGGEIRGQLSAPGRRYFIARLNGANERPDPVDTTGVGAGTFTLDNHLLQLEVSYSGLSGAPSAAHIHGPATLEQSADVLIGLNPLAVGNLDTSGRYSGQLTLGANTVLSLVQGLTYVNIHTEANPGGEIRGQILP